MKQQEIIIKMALHSWNLQVARSGQFIDSLNDDDFFRELAPGKNRALYVIGHLIAVHDAMNTILGLGAREHSNLDEVFVKNTDKAGLVMPSVSEVRQYWNEVHDSLHIRLIQVMDDEWVKKHELMTDDDFAKDATRNKLSVLLNRANHLAYHLGQLRLLK